MALVLKAVNQLVVGSNPVTGVFKSRNIAGIRDFFKLLKQELIC